MIIVISVDSRYIRILQNGKVIHWYLFVLQSAFEAYQDRELPRLKDEHPGLRLQQYKDLLYKKFQKSPENPYVFRRTVIVILLANAMFSRFNQTTVSYDASKEERVEALERRNREVEERLRERTEALSLDKWYSCCQKRQLRTLDRRMSFTILIYQLVRYMLFPLYKESLYTVTDSYW